MRLSGRNSLTSESSEGLLNLIDLAGSESLTKSCSAGDRLKETQAINKSLSCLSGVINALANQSAHIPFRDSKLTYLLQNSLSGNSKVLMFVNVSPLPENSQETLFSLQFATKVIPLYDVSNLLGQLLPDRDCEESQQMIVSHCPIALSLYCSLFLPSPLF